MADPDTDPNAFEDLEDDAHTPRTPGTSRYPRIPDPPTNTPIGRQTPPVEFGDRLADAKPPMTPHAAPPATPKPAP